MMKYKPISMLGNKHRTTNLVNQKKRKSLIPNLGNILTSLIRTGKNLNILDNEIEAITQNLNIYFSNVKTIQEVIMKDFKNIILLKYNILTLYFLNTRCHKLSNIIIGNDISRHNIAKIFYYS